MTARTMTFSPPLADGGIQQLLLQLSIEIFSIRAAVEGTGPYRVVEYITRMSCGLAVNEDQPLLNNPPKPDELFDVGRQYSAIQGVNIEEIILNPPQDLNVNIFLGQDENQHKYHFYAISIPVDQVARTPGGGGDAVRGVEVEDESSDDDNNDEEEEEEDQYSIDSELSRDAEVVETQVELHELEVRFDPNLSDEEEVVETQLDW